MTISIESDLIRTFLKRMRGFALYGCENSDDRIDTLKLIDQFDDMVERKENVRWYPMNDKPKDGELVFLKRRNEWDGRVETYLATHIGKGGEAFRILDTAMSCSYDFAEAWSPVNDTEITSSVQENDGRVSTEE